jgi:hypothetical protein
VRRVAGNSGDLSVAAAPKGARAGTAKPSKPPRRCAVAPAERCPSALAFYAPFVYYDGLVIAEDISMSLHERIEALKAKHHALEVALEEENNRPHPDDFEIIRLKKQKLQIKDELANLSARQ